MESINEIKSLNNYLEVNSFLERGWNLYATIIIVKKWGIRNNSIDDNPNNLEMKRLEYKDIQYHIGKSFANPYYDAFKISDNMKISPECIRLITETCDIQVAHNLKERGYIELNTGSKVNSDFSVVPVYSLASLSLKKERLL